jgi:hypothetical protein
MKDLKYSKRMRRESFATLIFLTSGALTSCRSVCLKSLFIREADRSTIKFNNIVDDRDHDEAPD